jgi:hypothetical protein
MKRIIITSLLPLSLLAKGPLLTDPILHSIDGIPGIFDGNKVARTLWLVQEIKTIHNGSIKINEKGAPDPGKKGNRTVDITFKGKKYTIKELIELENKKHTLSAADKQAFEQVFQLVKTYFGMAHNMLMADARGSQQFVIKLIQEYCRKYNRPDCLLLKWDEGSEQKMYEEDVVNFSVFYVLTTDLMNFLAVMVQSCPKAKDDFVKSHKKA